jgi:hypothetical protein
MKVVISHKKICIVKINQITCLNKVQLEWHFLRQQKIRIAGLYNAITIPAE